MREYMAQLGFRTIDEMVGHTDLLKKKDIADQYHIDLSKILDSTYANDAHNCFNPAHVYDFKLKWSSWYKGIIKGIRTGISVS